MKKKSLLVGIATSFVFYAVFHCLYLFYLKLYWWQDDVLKYFMPIWTIVMFYVGYALSNKYQRRKRIYFPNVTPENYNLEESRKGWQWEKLFMRYRACQIGKILFGASVPFYVFAYFEDGWLIYRNVIKIIILIIFTLIFWFYEYKLKKKLNI